MTCYKKMNAIRIADSADCELNASAEDEIVRLFDGLNDQDSLDVYYLLKILIHYLQKNYLEFFHFLQKESKMQENLLV